MQLTTQDHPEANGRKPELNDAQWVVKLPLESGEPLELFMGRKSRDMLFGMLLADCQDSSEAEPM